MRSGRENAGSSRLVTPRQPPAGSLCIGGAALFNTNEAGGHLEITRALCVCSICALPLCFKSAFVRLLGCVVCVRVCSTTEALGGGGGGGVDVTSYQQGHK